MSISKSVIGFLLTVLIFYFSFTSHGQTRGQLKLKRTVLIDGLSEPWDLAFTQSGFLFFTEKCYGLSVLGADSKVKKIFGKSAEYSTRADDLFCEGQSGILGLAVDPEFSKNRYVYVYMSSNLSKKPKTNRVVRLMLDQELSKVLQRVDIITDISFKDSFNSWGRAGAHSGGRLRFGPDNFLYITTGDNHNGFLPQNLNALGGKVLRVDRDGRPVPGYAIKNADPRILTYGHRNVQGIAFYKNRIYTSEHGPGHTDEVNIISIGKNYGWDPKPENGVSCLSNYCGYTSNKKDKTPTPMTDIKKFPDAVSPIWTNNGSSKGMGPLTFIDGAQWKSWSGSLLVGIMGAQRLAVLKLDEEGGRVISAHDADIPSERYRSLVQGPDGALYILNDGGSIWRVTLK